MHLRPKRKKGKRKRSRDLDHRQRRLLRRSRQVPQVPQCPAKASNLPSTSKTAAAAATMTKGETRVDQVLEAAVAKVIDNLKNTRYNSYLPPTVYVEIISWSFKSVMHQFCLVPVSRLQDCAMNMDFSATAGENSCEKCLSPLC